MAQAYDAVVIGGGHNGLTCACYLSAGGLRVRVQERRDIVGGAAVTEEFHPGFRNSTASYTVSLLQPKVIRDLRLVQHGLRILERPFSNFLPLGPGEFIKVGGGLAATQAEVARFSRRDAERLPAYYAMIDRVADLLRELILVVPPNVGGGWTDILRSVSLGKRMRALDTPARRDLLDLFTKSAGEMLDAWFESAPIKAAFGFDAVVGNFASPYTPGSAYVLLHHVFGEVNGKKGIWGHAVGGMGAITQAMAQEARALGVEISTGQAVSKVIVRDRRARGVVLADGTEIHAKSVIANVGPKLLFGQLVDASELEPDFRGRIERMRVGSGTFRMNVALAELPDFSALPGKAAAPHHSSGIIMAPSLAFMERAYHQAREHGWSPRPIVEILIPSTVDDTLAPAGQHVASLFCQHFSPTLPAGRSWDDERTAAADAILDMVNEYAPNFRASVLGRKFLSPLDLERDFGLIGGDIFHGALGLDQLFSARPVLGHADHRMPIERLYLCGSGAHPGGGVTGAPGHNAAHEILRDWRRGRLK